MKLINDCRNPGGALKYTQLSDYQETKTKLLYWKNLYHCYNIDWVSTRISTVRMMKAIKITKNRVVIETTLDNLYTIFHSLNAVVEQHNLLDFDVLQRHKEVVDEVLEELTTMLANPKKSLFNTIIKPFEK